MKKLLLAFLPFLFLSACLDVKDKCGPDEELGSIQLSAEGKLFFPVSGFEHLTFKNTAGDSLVFTSPDKRVLSPDNLIIASPCGENDLLDRTDQFYRRQTEVLRFAPSTTDFALIYILTTLNHIQPAPLDTAFFDIFQVEAPVRGLLLARASFMASERGNSAKLDDGLRTAISNGRRLVADTTLLTKSFQNVWVLKSSSGQDALFYTQTKGIVAFREPGADLWVLTKVHF